MSGPVVLITGGFGGIGRLGIAVNDAGTERTPGPVTEQSIGGGKTAAWIHPHYHHTSGDQL